MFERLSFLTAAVAFCVFLSVALTSAMTTRCLCDGLPGSQCEYCEGAEYDDVVGDTTDPGYQGAYYQAWEQEHLDFHHEWVERHAEYHKQPRTSEEERDFHRQMERAHQEFHGIVHQQLQ